MSTWGKSDNAANSVLSTVAQLNKAPTRANANTLYANVTTGAFITNLRIGQFGIDPTEKVNTSSPLSKSAHAGWNLRTEGTGSCVTLTIGAAGTLYANSDTFSFSAPGTGTTNATGTIGTNANGSITSVTFTNKGKGFVNTLVYATFTTTNGINANVSSTVGGRAGRLTHETMVAMGSIA